MKPINIITPNHENNKKSRKPSLSACKDKKMKNMSKLEKKSRIISKLQELTQQHKESAKKNDVAKIKMVYSMEAKRDPYLEVLENKVTLGYDLSKLQTLNRVGAEKANKKKSKNAPGKKDKVPVDQPKIDTHCAPIIKSENVFQLIKKNGLQRYNAHSATFLAYIAIAEKIATRGPHLDISIDQINKSEGSILGHVFYDFQHFKSIKLYSDPVSYSKIEGRTEMVKFDRLTLVKLSGQKLSQNMKDN